MDSMKGRGNKNFILKTWDRCRSNPGGHEKSLAMPANRLIKCKSWHFNIRKSFKDDKCKTKCRVAPEGCFSVYVGPEKQRFAIKTKYANHPLFKILLEDAELEYGYSCDGPILLPCGVDLFYKILAEMEEGKELCPRYSFAYGSCSPFSPIRRLGNSDMGKGCGSYGLLPPSRLIKMN